MSHSIKQATKAIATKVFAEIKPTLKNWDHDVTPTPMKDLKMNLAEIILNHTGFKTLHLLIEDDMFYLDIDDIYEGDAIYIGPSAVIPLKSKIEHDRKNFIKATYGFDIDELREVLNIPVNIKGELN